MSALAFQRDGYQLLGAVFSPQQLEQLWCSQVAPLDPRHNRRFKTHLLIPALCELLCSPSLRAPVQAALGTEDLLIWSSDWCIKPAHSHAYFSWHQDSTYAGMANPHQALTLWLAFTSATAASGCLQLVPRSHRWGQLPHDSIEHDEDNLLSRAQHITAWGHALDFGPVARAAELEPGEASLHSFRTVHASGPNSTSEARIGLAVRYCSAHVQREAHVQVRESALHVSGDLPANCAFDLESFPQEYNGLHEQAQWSQAMQRENANYFAGNSLRQEYHA
jgi:ectoine hydroxylase-related dioxygenase (phytanoyl-CoA dioxygenase family)